ncbi:MAG: hypothetical protein B6I28_04175 [Fusobacteriia bacterium 4572_132]|nr:MAG: hypothetical protein B6I28_04175 [Fusobacteriia bacterium 4572_132]
MATYREYQKAIEILELPQCFSINELKKVYKDKIKKIHPDISGNKNIDLDKIKMAYEILFEYMKKYKMKFDRENFQYDIQNFFEDKFVNEWEV